MPTIPKYRRNKKRGYAFLFHPSVPTADHRLYLGKIDSPASIAKYTAFIEKLAGVGSDEADDEPEDTEPPTIDPTVRVVAMAYLKHAKVHYKRGDELSKEYGHMVDAVGFLIVRHGDVIARKFGPKRLKAVRRRLVRRGLARKYINHIISRIKRVFRWASEEEIVPAGHYHKLVCVRGLYHGEGGVRDTEDVKTAPISAIMALAKHLPPAVADLELVQFYCGMRPTEACIIRACDIDMSGPIWLYRPQAHKTAWRGLEQVKAIPPIAQVIIKRNLRPDRDAYLFQPADAAAWCHEQRLANRKPRKTKRYPSEIRRVQVTASKRRRRVSRREPGECYSANSYYRALDYGFKRAAKAGVEIERFSPNQIRHSILTFVKQKLGQEAAQLWGGHEDIDTTSIYTENKVSDLVLVATQLEPALATAV